MSAREYRPAVVWIWLSQGNVALRREGGDPFIFGRGGEEIENRLAQNNIPSNCAGYHGRIRLCGLCGYSVDPSRLRTVGALCEQGIEVRP